MNLATQQRALLGLIRGNGETAMGNDEYIDAVARSRDLQEARRNIFLWRTYVLERTAALTFALLKRRGLLREVLGAFITESNISPFRETQAPLFLESLCSHADPLVASVAQFELALLRVKEGDRRVFVSEWSTDPYCVLNGLAQDLPIEDAAPGNFRVEVSNDLPYLFRIT